MRLLRKLTVLAAGCALALAPGAAAMVPRGPATTLSGTVVDAFQDEFDANFRFLVVQNESGTHYATSPSDDISKEFVDGLVGAEVTIDGIRDPASPPNRRFLGPTVFIKGSKDIHVLKPAPTDPFAVPEVNQDFTTNPAGIAYRGRHRMRGRVLAVWQGRSALIGREGQAPFSRIEFADGEVPRCGSFIEAVGYLETDLSSLNLTRARWRPTEAVEQPEPALTNITAKDLFSFYGRPALNATFYGKAVRIVGAVLNRTEGGRFQIDSGGMPVTVDVSALPAEAQTPEIGAKVEVAGICILDLSNWRPNDMFPRARGLFVAARSPDDVRVLARPSWWTMKRLLSVIVVLVGGLVAIIIWNLSLQALVVRRARQLYKADLKRATSELRVKDRTRLAVELHDALSQSLTGVSMEVEAAIRHGVGNPGEMTRHLAVADKVLKSCRNELRNSLWDLRNDALEARDLGEAIRRTLLPHVRDIALRIRFNVPRSLLTDNATHEILRIIRELAVNGISHGGAKSIHVAGGIDGGRLLFSVRDDGTGFDPDAAPGVLQGHFGLEGVRERLRQLKGSLVFERMPGGGMRATVAIPLPENKT